MKLPLKLLRENRKMTQAELGKRLNIAPSTVGMWEQGYRSPDYENLKRISKIFGVTTDYLLGNEAASKTSEIHLADDETKLVTDYRWLDTDGKNLVLNMLKRLRGASTLGEPPAANVVTQSNFTNSGANIVNVGNKHFQQNVTVR